MALCTKRGKMGESKPSQGKGFDCPVPQEVWMGTMFAFDLNPKENWEFAPF